MSLILDLLDKLPGFLYHISPQLIAVLIGGLILQKFFVSRSNEAALIDRLIVELNELRSDALEYWNLDCTKGDKGEKDEKRDRARLLEQKIKGAVQGLTSDLRYYSRRYRRNTDFPPLMVEVADACTGGQFESANKIAETSRYLTVVNAINRVKSELIRMKL